MIKKADLVKTRVGKYVVNRHKGMNKRDSAIEAGYAPTVANNPGLIENTAKYDIIEKKFFKDELLAQTTLQEIGEILVRNIKQGDNIAASNQAVQIALSKLEPTENTLDDSANKVLVVLR